MKILRLLIFILLASLQFQCKKDNPCDADICSNKRTTKQTAIKQEGVMGNYIKNNDRKWMINVFNNPG